MKKIIYYLIIAFGLFLIVDVFVTNPFNNKINLTDNKTNNQKHTYLVKTIYENKKEIFTIEELAYIPTYSVYPLEIEFENYKPDVPLSKLPGRVKLSTLGWIDIDTTITSTKNFFIRTVDKLGPVTYITFSSLDITEQNMKGEYSYCGPALDPSGIYFTAVRK